MPQFKAYIGRQEKLQGKDVQAAVLTLEQFLEKVTTLRAQILRYDQAYYGDNAPEVSDFEYDEIKNELLYFETTYPEVYLEHFGSFMASERVGSEFIHSSTASAKDLASDQIRSNQDESVVLEEDQELEDQDLHGLYAELVASKASFAAWQEIEHFQQVDDEQIDSLYAPYKPQEVDHEIPMLSLSNVYSAEEFTSNFYTQVEKVYQEQKLLGSTKNLNITFCAEPKFDGIACALIYRNGKLVRGATRGNGVRGYDITRHVQRVPNVPQELPELVQQYAATGKENILEVRGELLMLQEDFEYLNHLYERYKKKPLVNLRNGAGSFVSRDAYRRVIRKLRKSINGVSKSTQDLYIIDNLPKQMPLRFMAYVVNQHENIEAPELHANSQYQLLMFARRLGFTVSELVTQVTGFKQITEFYNRIEKLRPELSFDIDGTVFKVDNLEHQEAIGWIANSPKWAIAFKFLPNEAVTTLKDVTINVGRTGVVSPIAKVDPCFVAGATVSSLSLNNYYLLKRMDLHQDDKVVIYRGGEVIPVVKQALVDQRKPQALPVNILPTCPECGSFLQQTTNLHQTALTNLNLHRIFDFKDYGEVAKSFALEQAITYPLASKLVSAVNLHRQVLNHLQNNREIIYNHWVKFASYLNDLFANTDLKKSAVEADFIKDLRQLSSSISEEVISFYKAKKQGDAAADLEVKDSTEDKGNVADQVSIEANSIKAYYQIDFSHDEILITLTKKFLTPLVKNLLALPEAKTGIAYAQLMDLVAAKETYEQEENKQSEAAQQAKYQFEKLYTELSKIEGNADSDKRFKVVQSGALTCTNPAHNCSGQLEAKIEYFYSKSGIDLKGFGPAITNQFTSLGKFTNIADPYQMLKLEFFEQASDLMKALLVHKPAFNLAYKLRADYIKALEAKFDAYVAQYQVAPETQYLAYRDKVESLIINARDFSTYLTAPDYLELCSNLQVDLEQAFKAIEVNAASEEIAQADKAQTQPEASQNLTTQDDKQNLTSLETSQTSTSQDVNQQAVVDKDKAKKHTNYQQYFKALLLENAHGNFADTYGAYIRRVSRFNALQNQAKLLTAYLIQVVAKYPTAINAQDNRKAINTWLQEILNSSLVQQVPVLKEALFTLANNSTWSKLFTQKTKLDSQTLFLNPRPAKASLEILAKIGGHLNSNLHELKTAKEKLSVSLLQVQETDEQQLTLASYVQELVTKLASLYKAIFKQAKAFTAQLSSVTDFLTLAGMFNFAQQEEILGLISDWLNPATSEGQEPELLTVLDPEILVLERQTDLSAYYQKLYNFYLDKLKERSTSPNWVNEFAKAEQEDPRDQRDYILTHLTRFSSPQVQLEQQLGVNAEHLLEQSAVQVYDEQVRADAADLAAGKKLEEKFLNAYLQHKAKYHKNVSTLDLNQQALATQEQVNLEEIRVKVAKASASKPETFFKASSKGEKKKHEQEAAPIQAQELTLAQAQEPASTPKQESSAELDVKPAPIKLRRRIKQADEATAITTTKKAETKAAAKDKSKKKDEADKQAKVIKVGEISTQEMTAKAAKAGKGAKKGSRTKKVAGNANSSLISAIALDNANATSETTSAVETKATAKRANRKSKKQDSVLYARIDLPFEFEDESSNEVEPKAAALELQTAVVEPQEQVVVVQDKVSTKQAEELEVAQATTEANEAITSEVKEVESKTKATKAKAPKTKAKQASQAQIADEEVLVELPKAIEDTTEVVETQVKAVDTQVEAVETQAEVVDTQAEAVETQAEAVDTQVEALDTQNEAVYTQLETVETQAEAVDTQVEAVDTQVEAVGTQAEAVVTQVEAVDTQVEAVDTQAEVVGAQSKALDTQDEVVETQVKAVEEDSSAVEDNLPAIETDTKEVKSKVQRANSDKFFNEQIQQMLEQGNLFNVNKSHELYTFLRAHAYTLAAVTPMNELQVQSIMQDLSLASDEPKLLALNDLETYTQKAQENVAFSALYPRVTALSRYTGVISLYFDKVLTLLKLNHNTGSLTLDSLLDENRVNELNALLTKNEQKNQEVQDISLYLESKEINFTKLGYMTRSLIQANISDFLRLIKRVPHYASLFTARMKCYFKLLAQDAYTRQMEFKALVTPYAEKLKFNPEAINHGTSYNWKAVGKGWVNKEVFGGKIYKVLVDSFAEKKELKLSEFIRSIGINGVGPAVAEDLTRPQLLPDIQSLVNFDALKITKAINYSLFVRNVLNTKYVQEVSYAYDEQGAIIANIITKEGPKSSKTKSLHQSFDTLNTISEVNIVTKFAQMDKLSLDLEQIGKEETINTIGAVTLGNILQYFGDKNNQQTIQQFIDAGIKFKANQASFNNELCNKRVVVTGSLVILDRKACANFIKESGGKFSSSITLDTDILVIGGASSLEELPNTSKVKRAQELGVRLMFEPEFTQIYQQSIAQEPQA
ncbi:hypothetical protein [Psittacicella hinzii]|uniref:DNA ligase (NAD(+)) n=1 Tax=Psittacicella hinzii TaxID=2028575 RepID=A0A3A1YQR1_9GAMM|nr:hypothetical protein [Psittacicella hinzii]RIY39985.1 hypothetical protein CKF58_01270 [Psittacicella hinzii]